MASISSGSTARVQSPSCRGGVAPVPLPDCHQNGRSATGTEALLREGQPRACTGAAAPETPGRDASARARARFSPALATPWQDQHGRAARHRSGTRVAVFGAPRDNEGFWERRPAWVRLSRRNSRRSLCSRHKCTSTNWVDLPIGRHDRDGYQPACHPPAASQGWVGRAGSPPL